MTPEDKAAAREALRRGRLSIEEVEALLAEASKTGRPFAELARAREIILAGPPPSPSPSAAPLPHPRSPVPDSRFPIPASRFPIPLYPALLGASALIFLGLLVATIVYRLDRSRKDRELEVESARAQAESERQAREAGLAYHQRRLAEREAEARAAGDRGRQALAWIEERIGTDPTDPTIYDRAVQATLDLNLFLRDFPDDPDALVLRSRSWELRRNYAEALGDLERALRIKPALEPAVRVRLGILRKLNTRPGGRREG